MPRRTHYARLQKVEWRSGVCECQSARALTCLKEIEAHERGELATEPCPAGCAPEKRLVVAMRLSSWRNGETCCCPSCDPGGGRRETALVRQGLQRAPPSETEHDGVPSQYSDGTAGPVARPFVDAVGAPSGSGRGDVQRLPESAAVGRDVEPQSDPPHSPAPAAELQAGLVDRPAREAVVVVRHNRFSVPLGGPPPQLGPEDVVGAPEPYGDCAIPWCLHPLRAHRSWTEMLPCRYCGWPVTAHDGFDPALVFGLPYAARRAMACGVYLSIRFEGGDQDGCAVSGCACPGWRRNAPWISARESALQAQIEVRDRIIAENAEKLARLQAEYEARQRELLRAEGLTDNGPSPHGCPVYVEGANE